MPQSKFLTIWSFILFLTKLFYYCLIYPLEIAALSSFEVNIFSAYFSIIVDIFFLVDFVLKCFFIPYKDPHDLELVI